MAHTEIIDGKEVQKLDHTAQEIDDSIDGSARADIEQSFTNEQKAQVRDNIGALGSITSADVTGALGFTPYNATNPSGYQTSADVTSAINTKIGRTTNVNAADTNYTTYMARGEALTTVDTTPPQNGEICWTYQ